MKLTDGLKLFGACVAYTCLRNWIFEPAYRTANTSVNDIFGFGPSTVSATYGEAVESISKGLSSYYASNAIAVLPKNGSGSFYAAVAAIANSGMSSYYKNEAICRISKGEGQK